MTSAVDSIAVKIAQTSGQLEFIYQLTADLSILKIPSRQTPSATDGLWNHTCFEAFIGIVGDKAYHEFNFSPSTQWASYQFDDYREISPLQCQVIPEIDFSLTETRLTLSAKLPGQKLNGFFLGKKLSIGIASVIETNDGLLSYWALKHTTEKPDFHQRNGFIHEIWY